jgi:hypothetical protein
MQPEGLGKFKNSPHRVSNPKKHFFFLPLETACASNCLLQTEISNEYFLCKPMEVLKQLAKVPIELHVLMKHTCPYLCCSMTGAASWEHSGTLGCWGRFTDSAGVCQIGAELCHFDMEPSRMEWTANWHRWQQLFARLQVLKFPFQLPVSSFKKFI